MDPFETEQQEDVHGTNLRVKGRHHHNGNAYGRGSGLRNSSAQQLNNRLLMQQNQLLHQILVQQQSLVRHLESRAVHEARHSTPGYSNSMHSNSMSSMQNSNSRNSSSNGNGHHKRMPNGAGASSSSNSKIHSAKHHMARAFELNTLPASSYPYQTYYNGSVPGGVHMNNRSQPHAAGSLSSSPSTSLPPTSGSYYTTSPTDTPPTVGAPSAYGKDGQNKYNATDEHITANGIKLNGKKKKKKKNRRAAAATSLLRARICIRSERVTKRKMSPFAVFAVTTK
eukprot:TRINITY_DN4424_c0_g1_i2.p1 TRINITY_DN4424_c0_g1~~TRINITY_DN4424_c0_g1_i2.p1  ORF type:complete len:282 (+),score=54.29 TRINITY_DN4424_c0_g1_i2:328-1173(+)